VPIQNLIVFLRRFCKGLQFGTWPIQYGIRFCCIFYVVYTIMDIHNIYICIIHVLICCIYTIFVCDKYEYENILLLCMIHVLIQSIYTWCIWSFIYMYSKFCILYIICHFIQQATLFFYLEVVHLATFTHIQSYLWLNLVVTINPKFSKAKASHLDTVSNKKNLEKLHILI